MTNYAQGFMDKYNAIAGAAVEKGLWEKPTVLNNVETYANVA